MPATIIFGSPGPLLEMRRFRVVRSLEFEAPGGSLEAALAESFGERLLGLAGRAAPQGGSGLLIPRCCSVHTVGMRFRIDIAFLGWPAAPRCPVLAVHEGVGAMRVSRLRGRAARATAVLEVRAGVLAALGVQAGGSLALVWEPAYAAVNFTE